MINAKERLQGSNILVTGGAGFVGSHLCDKLLGYGAKVICFDNLSTGNKSYIDSLKNNLNFTFILGDANKFSDLEKVFSKYNIDYIFHYAAVVGVQRTIENPLDVLNDLEGIKYICKLSAENNIKKIIFSSSSEIYGNQDKLPFNEDLSCHDTRHPYALVKAIGESYFKSCYELTGIPTTSLRFFNVYGPRQASSRYGFVVGIFVSQILKDMQPTIFRDGTQTRDFTYIDDNIECAIQVLLNKKTDGKIMNIGTGVETSVRELAEGITKISNKKLEPVFLNEINLVETQRRVADISKMKELVSFKPNISLDEGLKITYKWYEENPEFIMDNDQMGYSLYKKTVWEPQRQ